MNMINVNNLTKIYGDFTAVDHISFSVEEGSMLGFLGVNGAGKTTTISMLTTLLKPESGTVTICDHELGKNDKEIRRDIGVVYQQNCLDDQLSVYENLITRGILHGATKVEAKERFEELSDILKLDDIKKKRYKMLSGGQKRRAEIAAALMHTPKILFLDEPTTGLDPATRMDVWNAILTLQKTTKMTVFLTTHYMEEAAKANQIIILDHGHIVATGTPFALKEQYAKDRLILHRDENGEDVTEEIKLETTMDAIQILQNKKDEISGFEVIQGNMDDVFMNAVGSIDQKEA